MLAPITGGRMQDQAGFLFEPFRLDVCDERLWHGPAALPLCHKTLRVLHAEVAACRQVTLLSRTGFHPTRRGIDSLDQWCDAIQPILPGAVTTGDIWQFGPLQRDVHLVTQDVQLYRVPADVKPVLCRLVAALTG